ncbi:Uncharacterized protein Adt_20354 [Abeliophyllum distichum]|uniref:Uncharacterized protein n=1 Tax=Abeliophyllum distichum TaxID=126358 RepID=A0ABD1SWB5_9LAMI
MQRKSKKESKVRWLIKAPVRVLSKARDLYVQSLSGCAGEVHSSVLGWPASLQLTNLPESFSGNSSFSNNDDVYATTASSKSLTSNIEWESLRRLRQQSEPNVVAGRSQYS